MSPKDAVNGSDADKDTSDGHNTIVGETDAAFDDLLSFLASPRADLRRAAAEAALSMLVSTTTEDGGGSVTNDDAARQLTSRGAVRALSRIASATPEEGSLAALAALSVLCGRDRDVGNQCVEDFVEAGGIGRTVEIALSGIPSSSSSEAMGEWRKRVNYACALLANATRTERGAVAFLGKAFPDEAIPSSSSAPTDVSTSAGGGDTDAGGGGDSVGGGGPPAEETVPTTREASEEPAVALLLSRFTDPSLVDAEAAELRRRKKDEYDSDPDEADNDDIVNDADGSKTNEDEHYDPYQHVAAVIMNVTQLETGMNFFLKLRSSSPSLSSGDNKDRSALSPTSLLQSLLPQLASPNVNRRRGIAGTIKNCCFSQNSLWWLLNVVRIDKCILYSLAGPEELDVDEKVGLDPDFWLEGPNKVRESDTFTRLYVVEAMLLILASGRKARETLRERRAYVIIKMADMVEESEEVSERMLECVQYLRRDEEGDWEGSSDQRAYEKYSTKLSNGLRKALPASSASGAVRAGEEEDFDEID